MNTILAMNFLSEQYFSTGHLSFRMTLSKRWKQVDEGTFIFICAGFCILMIGGHWKSKINTTDRIIH